MDPALILILADEATLAGVVGADGSPVHPSPVPPGARQPPNHYMNAIRDWIKDRVATVATASTAMLMPDLSALNIPMPENLIIFHQLKSMEVSNLWRETSSSPGVECAVQKQG